MVHNLTPSYFYLFLPSSFCPSLRVPLPPPIFSPLTGTAAVVSPVRGIVYQGKEVVIPTGRRTPCTPAPPSPLHSIHLHPCVLPSTSPCYLDPTPQ